VAMVSPISFIIMTIWVVSTSAILSIVLETMVHGIP
jgi:hypothetical protein